VLQESIRGNKVPMGQISRSMVRWEFEAERSARDDGSFRVGERHLLDLITSNELAALGINVAGLRAMVRELELGPALPVDELASWKHHCVLDSSALIQYHRPDQIPWAKEMGSGPVMLWLVGSVLNELDTLKLADRRRARIRARERSRWISQLLDEALGDTGVEVRKSDSTRLKAWLPPTSGLRDTDHLESVLALRGLGVDALIVSDDLNMSARARMADLRVVRLDSWRLPDDEEDRPT
jgi:hypothetical protein